MGVYKVHGWEFCKVVASLKTMGMTFSRSSKMFKNTRLVNMIHCKMSNVSPKRSRVSESVWQTLVRTSFHMEDKAKGAIESMLCVAPLMAQQHLCKIFQTRMEVVFKCVFKVQSNKVHIS
jgi:hypothetical protein